MELKCILYFAFVFSLKIFLVDCQCDQRPFGGTMMCCSGRNSHCYVKVRNSPKNGTSSRGICYCDEYCKITKDCCKDFDKIRESCRGENVFFYYCRSVWRMSLSVINVYYSEVFLEKDNLEWNYSRKKSALGCFAGKLLILINDMPSNHILDSVIFDLENIWHGAPRFTRM